MAGMQDLVVSARIALASSFTSAQIASLDPAEEHHWEHEKTWNKRHDYASTSSVLVPRVHLTILVWRIYIVDELEFVVDDWCNEGRYQVDALNENKAVEVSVIAPADAIVDPRTMMIEPINADAAQVAVAAARCLDDFAVWT